MVAKSTQESRLLKRAADMFITKTFKQSKDTVNYFCCSDDLHNNFIAAVIEEQLGRDIDRSSQFKVGLGT